MTNDPEFDAWLKEENAKSQAEIASRLERAEENERKQRDKNK